MRILYLLLDPTLNYAFRIYFRRIAHNKSPKRFLGRTIFVSNHAASFMDPLVIAALNRPIIFFLTRSDVFSKYIKPILWLSHMLPIYRQHDGEDTKSKNEEVFKRCSKILSGGRNILIFGEGFTDDTFIRRLKPVKKGAVRIGFIALEHLDWKKKIYISGLGVNYTDPNQMRSDVLCSYSERICLNDYKDAFQENPNKVINELTKEVELLMQQQITHVSNKDDLSFHENIMTVNRKGLNPQSYDGRIPLKTRWRYSQSLANWINKKDISSEHQLDQLKTNLSDFIGKLKSKNLNPENLYWKSKGGSRAKEIILLVLLFPLMVLGLIHCAIPYIIAKRFTEKSFKRKVFWGSVKMMLGLVIMGIINIPVIFIMYHFVYPSWLFAFAYYFLIGWIGLGAYLWFTHLKEFKAKGRTMKMDTSDLIKEYENLNSQIEELIDVD